MMAAEPVSRLSNSLPQTRDKKSGDVCPGQKGVLEGHKGIRGGAGVASSPMITNKQ